MQSDWHISKTLTIGNMLTMGIAIIALLGSYYTMDKRVSMLESAHVDLVKHQSEEVGARKADTERVCKRLDEINSLIMKVHFGQIKEE